MAWSRLRRLFHRTFSRLSRIWSTDSEPKAIVDRRETITRFIVRRDHFTATRVKWNAFQPYDNPTSRRLETSVYREVGLAPADIWRLGRQHVENPEANRLIKARGTGPVAAILDSGLVLDVNGPPEPIHADIVGWPADKHAQRQKAMEFANHFKVERAPSP